MYLMYHPQHLNPRLFIEEGVELREELRAGRLALGACESEGGPTCIVGDARRNVRLNDETWADALDWGDDADGVEAEPQAASEAAELDVDEYPDL